MILSDIHGNKYYVIDDGSPEHNNNPLSLLWLHSSEKIHREDGPAIEYSNGDKFWYKNGKRHRDDGPAVELGNGINRYYYYNQQINCSTNEEFFKLVKFKLLW